MTPAPNDRLIKALLRQPVDATPVWIMRQAGRYLPEYRRVRARAGDFLNLCKPPELACEATLQPVSRFPLDAAILFSDILVVPEAMGMELRFHENEGPCFPAPLRCARDLRALNAAACAERLWFQARTIELVRGELAGRLPLIGFAGSPWTLAAYMVEGQGGGFAAIKTLMLERPDVLESLLDMLSDAVAECLNAQIRAGVDCVMIFDSWGGVLAADRYRQFSLEPTRKAARQLLAERDGKKIPSILFARGGGLWLEDMADSGFDALGLDWTIDIGAARRRVGARVALQGNLDPSALFANSETIREEARRVITAYGKGPGHVFNLGHGIDKRVEPEKVAVLVNAVHEFSARFNAPEAL